MRDRSALLAWEAMNLSKWLSNFDAAGSPRVVLEPSGHTLRVNDFPLPDGYSPDRVNLAIKVSDYPVDPPKGLYHWSRPRRVRRIFATAMEQCAMCPRSR